MRCQRRSAADSPLILRGCAQMRSSERKGQGAGKTRPLHASAARRARRPRCSCRRRLRAISAASGHTRSSSGIGRRPSAWPVAPDALCRNAQFRPAALVPYAAPAPPCCRLTPLVPARRQRVRRTAGTKRQSPPARASMPRRSRARSPSQSQALRIPASHKAPAP